MIQSLINKKDNFEIVGEKISEILKLEIINQLALAAAEPVDTAPYDIDVYRERYNPWEIYREDVTDQNPIVNVAFDSYSDELKKGNSVDRQHVNAVFNIDCYARGLSRSEGEGHIAGDKDAALRLHAVARLIRNILMASTNTYLDLRGIVWFRRVSNLTVFQPQYDAQNAINVMGARIVFDVSFSEFSPQYEGEELETVSIKVKRQEDGLVILDSEYATPVVI